MGRGYRRGVSRARHAADPEHHPTTFFGTNTWAAPVLGTRGGVFILIVGLTYLEWRRRAAYRMGEG